ncbi:hypothetical protein P175DRAFT_0460728 [Aspergillus ochraceoroseus IBT 24754]|uniref:F-box domain-containing protein n=2 Tax=Aspergillus ochraceoroseus TaxID=138278 RepID=A0A2T5LV91_9EURO|nr:uncharacterized protein P175DRAFT_0460728 [Aspergillus ochraceoroseus IBT 24754]KKK14438.1 hypothetical protein AOCH_001236 [Aspergillus ochraceoroseus]PTU20197.1 hypothetical protein P175DRAFT_0460728 [Aspergillus ochraceoroseus IBT 24754]
MLLNLPLELIQLILLKCTTQTFLQVAFSCRTLYGIASNYREALAHHLRQTPGFRRNQNISSTDTKQLFQILKQHAFQQLYGSQFRANCTKFNFGEQILNVPASSLASFGNKTLIFTTCQDQRLVHVFQVADGKLTSLAQLKLPWDQSGRLEVSKIAFDGEDKIYVLQRFTPAIDEHGPDAEHPFIRQAKESSRYGKVYLTRHSLQCPDGLVRICDFVDDGDIDPSALAVNCQGTFAIVWHHRQYADCSIQLYTGIEEAPHDPTSNLIGLTCQSIILKDWAPPSPPGEAVERRLITDLEFNDRSMQLLYYYQSRTLYRAFQSCLSESPHLYRNSTPVTFTPSLSLLFSIGIPFFGTHETESQNGFETCRWRYLALGIATHRQENWTVACLMRSEAVCRASNCGHELNLDRGRRLTDWVIAARLWGFRDATSSLGCKVATSRDGTRIAVSNWKTIYVWALDPGSLIDLNENEYYPPSWQSSETGLIDLPPMVLHTGAVCFQLCFTREENELVAITDQGFMLWDLRASGTGNRTSQVVDV